MMRLPIQFLLLIQILANYDIAANDLHVDRRRLWITTFDKLRFCTSVPNDILTNRVQLKAYLEIKLQRRLRSFYRCGKIHSLVRSSLSSNTNDMFVKISWREMTCSSQSISTADHHIITVDANTSHDSTTRNDSKERSMESSSTFSSMSSASTSRTMEKDDPHQRTFVSMEGIERELASLEIDVIELAADPEPKQNLVAWLASRFLVGFVTMAAGTTVLCWLIAYRAEALCSIRDDDNGANSPGTLKRTSIIEQPSQNGTSTKSQHRKPSMKSTKRKRKRRARAPDGLRVVGIGSRKKMLEEQNYRIEQSVTRLQELLAEAGPWGTVLDPVGQSLLTCRGQLLTLERSIEMASYTIDSEEEEEEVAFAKYY